LILEEQNSFKIIGTWAEQFSGMGNFAMTRGCHRERGWNQQIMMLENG
jgi:hypothetical protein